KERRLSTCATSITATAPIPMWWAAVRAIVRRRQALVDHVLGEAVHVAAHPAVVMRRAGDTWVRGAASAPDAPAHAWHRGPSDTRAGRIRKIFRACRRLRAGASGKVTANSTW